VSPVVFFWFGFFFFSVLWVWVGTSHFFTSFLLWFVTSLHQKRTFLLAWLSDTPLVIIEWRNKMTWHFSCVTGLLGPYTGLPPQVTVRKKGNFSLAEDWLAGWIFCMAHRALCLSGQALLLTSPVAVPMPTPTPCSSRSPVKAWWCSARKGSKQCCVAGLQRGVVAGLDIQDPSPSQGTSLFP